MIPQSGLTAKSCEINTVHGADITKPRARIEILNQRARLRRIADEQMHSASPVVRASDAIRATRDMTADCAAASVSAFRN